MCQMNQIHKVILLGDANVGKTSICTRKFRGQFVPTAPTIGVANSKVFIELPDKKVEMSIWDTAGQEQFQSITPLYLKNAEVCIIVASLFDAASIQHINKWYDQVVEVAGNIPTIVAINKIDIIGNPPFSMGDIATKLDEKFKTVFFISAKNGTGINELFIQTAKFCDNNRITKQELKETKSLCC